MIERFQVKQWFTEAVKLDVEAPSDLKETLLRGHPNIERFIDNLTTQFRQAETVCRKRGTVLKLKTIQDTVYDFTKLFMKGMEGEAKKRYESDMQKIMRQKEADKIKEFDSVLAGNPEGEFAEAGVISENKIDEEREQGNFKASAEEGFKAVIKDKKESPKVFINR